MVDAAPTTQAIATIEDMQKAAKFLAFAFGMTEPQAVAVMLISQADGIHPAHGVRDHHIIENRPTIKAEALLSRFQRRSGYVKWVRFDNEAAVAEFSHPINQRTPITVSCTWEEYKETAIPWRWDKEAKKYELKANWRDARGAMLRARCIARGVRMVDPGASNGMMVPEEAQDAEGVAVHAAPTSRAESLRLLTQQADAIVAAKDAECTSTNAPSAETQQQLPESAPPASTLPASQPSTAVAEAKPTSSVDAAKNSATTSLPSKGPATIEDIKKAAAELSKHLSDVDFRAFMLSMNERHKCGVQANGTRRVFALCPAENCRAYVDDINEEIRRISAEKVKAS